MWSFFLLFHVGMLIFVSQREEGLARRRAVMRVCYFERCFIVLLPQLIKWWFYNLETH